MTKFFICVLIILILCKGRNGAAIKITSSNTPVGIKYSNSYECVGGFLWREGMFNDVQVEGIDNKPITCASNSSSL